MAAIAVVAAPCRDAGDKAGPGISPGGTRLLGVRLWVATGADC